jgi:antitoxin HicB
MSELTLHYSIVIEWSEEDQTYVVILPEWVEQHYVMPVASGKTYAEALKRGQNALEHLIQIAQEDGTPLPAPRLFVASHA